MNLPKSSSAALFERLRNALRRFVLTQLYTSRTHAKAYFIYASKRRRTKTGVLVQPQNKRTPQKLHWCIPDLSRDAPTRLNNAGFPPQRPHSAPPCKGYGDTGLGGADSPPTPPAGNANLCCNRLFKLETQIHPPLEGVRLLCFPKPLHLLRTNSPSKQGTQSVSTRNLIHAFQMRVHRLCRFFVLLDSTIIALICESRLSYSLVCMRDT
jgi:hypothetical protein